MPLTGESLVIGSGIKVPDCGSRNRESNVLRTACCRALLVKESIKKWVLNSILARIPVKALGIPRIGDSFSRSSAG